MNVCSSLNKLKKLYPIKGCVHIGVGGPHSLQLYEQLDVENVVFIDANQQRLNSLSPKFAQRPGWVRLCKVIGAQVSERTYYETNSANENGLISAEDLRPLWKNLQVKRQSARDVIDLTSCLIEHQEEINLDNPNFLNIDCFPALDVLTGADELLGKMDLVVTRVVTDEDLASKINGVSAKKINVFLREKGFIKFATEVENHPAVSKVVYAKDLSSELIVLTKDQEKKQREIEGLIKLLEEQSKTYDIKTRKLKDEVIKITRERDLFLPTSNSRSLQVTDKNLAACVIVVAGMRHSGSTALFNILRLCLLSAELNITSGYSESKEYQSGLGALKGVHLVKAHELRDDLIELGDIFFTSRRDLRNSVASAVRRNFPKLESLGVTEYAKYNRMLYDVWLPYSNFEFIYEEFLINPIEIIKNITKTIGVEGVDCNGLYQQIINLPQDNYDETLLSKHHITDPERKLTFSDTLDDCDVKNIEIMNKRWLARYGYM